MPKHRKRRIMLSIVSIVLFVVLSAQLSTFSFSVTAARRNTGSVAEEYVRYQSRLQNIEKITDLEENGFRLLEDQVFAMPLQKVPEDTPEGFRRSLDKCLELGADDITIHTLALKKGSRILLEHLTIPSAEAVGEMLDYANEALRAADFAPYYLYRQKYMSGSFENVGWSRPGGECWYNVDIMSELCSILSFGAGGSTKMVEPGTNHIERVFNVKYPKEYTERPEKTLQNQAAFAEFYAKYVPEA